MVEPLTLLIDRLQTPIGELLIVADHAGKLRTIDWTDHEARMRRLLDRYYSPKEGKGAGYTLAAGARSGWPDERHACLLQGRHRRDRPAAGRRDGRHALPEERLARPAQDQEWQDDQLCRAGAGARQAQGGARRGPGQRPDPISIVVPCHRVIGSSGTLTGYGGGLPRKKWLLEHEGALRVAA